MRCSDMPATKVSGKKSATGCRGAGSSQLSHIGVSIGRSPGRSDMAGIDEARLDRVLREARTEGHDQKRAFAEFRAVLEEWLQNGPLNVSEGNPLAGKLCDMFMDPDEGPVTGGEGIEHLNFAVLNRMRRRLFEQYGLPLTRFANTPPV